MMSVKARVNTSRPRGGRFSYMYGRSIWFKFRLALIVAPIIVLIYCYFLNYITGLHYKANSLKDNFLTHRDADYIVLTEGCRILDLAPFDFDMVPYFTKLEKKEIECDPSGLGELIKSTEYELYVNKSVLRKLKLKNVKCCYTPFGRWTPPLSKTGIYPIQFGQQSIYGIGRCIEFWKKTVIHHQFIYAKCYDKRTNVVYHQDYFTFAVVNSDEVDYEKQKRFKSFPDVELEEEEEEFIDDTAGTEVLPPYSVFIIGFDGMSRLNFERQMPRTMSFIREQGGVSLLGYNKVGYNTFPNLMPALTGKNVSEIIKTCWPTNRSVLDDCPFIWKAFKGRGYFTAYGEDAPKVSTFVYAKPGFRVKPVDYYMQPYFMEAEENLKTRRYNEFTSIFCVGLKENSARFENAVHNFVSRFKNHPTFGLFWFNGMSHDYLNFPRTYDQRFYKMFTSLNEKGAFNSTIIVVMSDHGIRWGRFRQTFQGFLEERLPLSTIVLPPSFKQRFPRATANLETNSKRLTTPFDLHETLWDIVDMGRLPDQTIFDMNAIRIRGMSLFYPIPEKRTCQSAGVPTEYCACDERKLIDSEDPLKYFFADKVISILNEMLTSVPQCAWLELSHIDAVWENRPYSGNDQAVNVMPLHRDFIVRLTATPGNGIFEAQIRLKKPQTMSIIGVISRLNMYNNDSVCVNDEQLKLYCYCLSESHSSNEYNLLHSHDDRWITKLVTARIDPKNITSQTDPESEKSSAYKESSISPTHKESNMSPTEENDLLPTDQDNKSQIDQENNISPPYVPVTEESW